MLPFFAPPYLRAFRQPFTLETAVGRVRVGCDGVRWQDADAAAPARKEKQRRKQAPARLNRARRVVTLEVTLLVGKKAGVHGAYPAEESGQLRFLGSLTRAWSEPLWLHHTVHSKPWQKQQTDHLSVIDRTDILQRMPEAHAPLAVAQRAYQTAWRCNLPMIGTLVRCNRRPG